MINGSRTSLMAALKETITKGGIVADLFKQYPLTDWLTTTSEGYPLGFLLNGWVKVLPPSASLHKSIKAYKLQQHVLLAAWWHYFKDGLTLELLQQRVKVIHYDNQSPLYIFACLAAHGYGRVWKEIWDRFGPQITRLEFDQQALDGSDKGKSIVWLLACAAANSQFQLWQAFWQQCHPLFKLADFRIYAQQGAVAKGKTVFWYLSAAAVKGCATPWQEVWAYFPAITLQDLRNAAQNGPFKNTSVLLNLIRAAALKELDVWERVYEKFSLELTVADLTQKVTQGLHEGFSVWYFLMEMACANKGTCRAQVSFFIERFPELLADKPPLNGVGRSWQQLLQDSQDDWSQVIVGRMKSQQVGQAKHRQKELNRTLREMAHHPSCDLTRCLSQYGLEDWLAPSAEGMSSLQFLMIGCSDRWGEKPQQAWWQRFSSSLTVADLGQVTTKGELRGTNLLWLFADQILKIGPSYWNDMMSKFGAQLRLKEFRVQAQDNIFLGISGIWLVASAAGAHHCVWLSFYKQFGPELTLNDLRTTAQSPEHKGKTVLWQLARVLYENNHQPNQALLNSFKEIWRKFPEVGLADLLAKSTHGSRKNQSVLFLLMGAVNGDVELWREMWSRIKKTITWDLIRAKVDGGRGAPSNKSILNNLMKMAYFHLEIGQVVYDKYAQEITYADLAEPIIDDPKNTDYQAESTEGGHSILWHIARTVTQQAPTLWQTVWQKFKAVMKVSDLVRMAQGGPLKGYSVLTFLASRAQENPKLWNLLWEKFKDELTLAHLRGDGVVGAALWELAHAGVRGEIAIWNTVWNKYKKELQPEDFDLACSPCKSFTVLYFMVQMAVANRAEARKHLSYLLESFPDLFTPERLLFKDPGGLSMSEMINSCQDLGWREEVTTQMKSGATRPRVRP